MCIDRFQTCNCYLRISSKESPCINAGANQSWMQEAGGVDLDRRQRLDRFSRLVDMGCYEYVPTGMMMHLR